jgi:hypothetical protein
VAVTPRMPCRRCGQPGGDVTLLWRADPTGALAPYAAQCRPRCPDPSPPPRRARRRDRLELVTDPCPHEIGT